MYLDYIKEKEMVEFEFGKYIAKNEESRDQNSNVNGGGGGGGGGGGNGGGAK